MESKAEARRTLRGRGGRGSGGSESKKEKRHAGWHHLHGTGRAAWEPSEGEGNGGLRRETAAAEAAMAAAA